MGAWENDMAAMQASAVPCPQCGTMQAVHPLRIEGKAISICGSRDDMTVYVDVRAPSLCQGSPDNPGYCVTSCSVCRTRYVVEVPWTNPKKTTVVWQQSRQIR